MSNCNDNLKPSNPPTSTSGIKGNKTSGSIPKLPATPEREQKTKITKGQIVNSGGISSSDLTQDATESQGSGVGSGGSSSQAQASAQPAKTKEQIQKEEQKKKDDADVLIPEKQWVQPETEYARKNGEDIEGKDLYPNQEKKSKEFKPVSIYPFNKCFQTESGHVLAGLSW